jgi:hypothetical protein
MASDGKSGRAQGSGEGKPAGKKPAPRSSQSHGRRGLALDSETTARLLIFGAVALVMLIAVGFLVFGYWYSVIRPRNRTVLAVDNITVSYTAMKRRMAYEFLNNTAYQSQNGLQVLPQGTYQTLLNELTKVTQAESKLSVTLTDAEFDTALRQKIVVAASADQRTFADALRKELDTDGLSESELYELVRASALDAKIQDKFKAETPATVLQAQIEVISAQTQDAVQKAIDRINGGEDFAAVAKEVSTEPDVATTGGLHQYGPQGSFNAAYDDYAFSGAVGALSAPLSSGGSSPTFYTVRVVDRSDQPVQDSEKPAIATKQLADWLKSTQDELEAAGKIKTDWNQQAQSDALLSVINDAGPKLVAKQQQQQQDQQKAQDVRQTTVAELTASPQASTPPAPDSTPGPESTRGSDATPASGATAAATQANNAPIAPSQPIAPDSNGQ